MIKDIPFDFSHERLHAFENSKNNLPFELICDISDYAIGTILGQRKDEIFLLSIMQVGL